MRCPDTGCGEPICEHGCLRTHEVLVRNLVYHITRNPNEVEDLVQEVLMKAYNSLSLFRGGSFRAYLAQIARNHCYDWLRRKRTKRVITPLELVSDLWAADFAGPEEQYLQKETSAELMEVLDELGDPDREILLLRHVHQFDYEEIGAVLGMKAGTVRTRMSRARHKVMEMMERRGQGGSSQLG
jgi:RNA polymerase sigma factor (sigma-70 family)